MQFWQVDADTVNKLFTQTEKENPIGNASVGGAPIGFLYVLFYGISFKFGFVGQGLCPWTPPKNFLKEVLWNLKNFQKGIFENAF